MKRIFYIVAIFSTLAISLLLGSYNQQPQSANTVDYIKKVATENTVLASSNATNGEITSSQQKDDQNFSGSAPLVATSQSFDNLFDKNKSQSNGYSIHNISTSKQKTHNIRAP